MHCRQFCYPGGPGVRLLRQCLYHAGQCGGCRHGIDVYHCRENHRQGPCGQGHGHCRSGPGHRHRPDGHISVRVSILHFRSHCGRWRCLYGLCGHSRGGEYVVQEEGGHHPRHYHRRGEHCHDPLYQALRRSYHRLRLAGGLWHPGGHLPGGLRSCCVLPDQEPGGSGCPALWRGGSSGGQPGGSSQRVGLYPEAGPQNASFLHRLVYLYAL